MGERVGRSRSQAESRRWTSGWTAAMLSSETSCELALVLSGAAAVGCTAAERSARMLEGAALVVGGIDAGATDAGATDAGATDAGDVPADGSAASDAAVGKAPNGRCAAASSGKADSAGPDGSNRRDGLGSAG